jgi:hypothetical protein
VPAVAERRDLRAADVDRQFVAERLKGALDEGRLSLTEYDERLRDVYSAKTYGDLDGILSDLPGFAPQEHSQLQPAASSAVDQHLYPTDAVRQEFAAKHFKGVPKWLVGIWGAWLVAVAVNLVIWALVCVSNGEFVYFWPMWVAGPWGAILLGTTITAAMTGDPEKHIEQRAAEREARRRSRRGRYEH